MIKQGYQFEFSGSFGKLVLFDKQEALSLQAALLNSVSAGLSRLQSETIGEWNNQANFSWLRPTEFSMTCVSVDLYSDEETAKLAARNFERLRNMKLLKDKKIKKPKS